MERQTVTCALFVVIALCFGGSSGPVQGQMASISSAPASRIVPPSPSFQFSNGQKLVYSVEWHLLNAGTATILLQRSQSGEHLRSTADTAGMTNKIFPVHDIFDAEIDPHTFCTLQTSKHSEEGSRRLDRKVFFDYKNAKSQVDDNDLKSGKRRQLEFDIPHCVTDVVSGFFYAASLDLGRNFSELFPVNEAGKTSDVRIQVEGRNTLKLPAGEFAAIRVKAEPVSGAMKDKGVLWVWFTDDKRRLPVQMKSKLGFASLLFRLESIETTAPTQ